MAKGIVTFNGSVSIRVIVIRFPLSMKPICVRDFRELEYTQALIDKQGF